MLYYTIRLNNRSISIILFKILLRLSAFLGKRKEPILEKNVPSGFIEKLKEGLTILAEMVSR